MRFFALIDSKSAIFRDWKEHHRLSGVVDDIVFKLVRRNYISDELTDTQIQKIITRQDKAILLEVMHVLPSDNKRIEEKITKLDVPPPISFTVSTSLRKPRTRLN